MYSMVFKSNNAQTINIQCHIHMYLELTEQIILHKTTKMILSSVFVQHTYRYTQLLHKQLQDGDVRTLPCTVWSSSTHPLVYTRLTYHLC